MMMKSERQELGFWSVSEAARKIGITPPKMHYHVDHGYVKQPKHQFGIKFYYSTEDLNHLAKYFDGRIPCQHQEDK